VSEEFVVVEQRPNVTVRDNPEAGRYEALVGEAVAGFAEYRLVGGRVVFTHTEVADAFEGHGVGSVLAKAALDDVRAKGKPVTPLCPFIAAYIRRHPEYVDLVDEAHRGQFDAAKQ
jgi:predicted GNAT family acetyltransferase